MWGIALLLCAVAACGDDGGSMPPSDGGDTQDAPPITDAALPALTVVWEADPSLPGSAGTGTTVSSAVFRVGRLQVIGDNGEPANTTVRDLLLAWDSTTPPDPTSVMFFAAPPALYSKVRVVLDHDDENNPSVEIRGTFTSGSDAEKFRITSRSDTTFEVRGYQALLEPGGQAEVRVRVDLTPALGEIDFTSLAFDADDDEYVLDDTQPFAMNAFLDDLEDVFRKPD